MKWYSKEERKFLRNNFQLMTNAQLGAAIGRTESSVVWQLTQMKLHRAGKKFWTKKELDQLRTDAPHFSRKQLATRFNTTVDKITSAVKNHKIKSGRTGHFPKGNVPWSAGKKMPANWGGETRFKKGALPHNTLADGTIIIRKFVDGRKYKWIRISENNWRPLSHVVYESSNGPLPADHFVSFKDGNTLNVDPANLESVSKQQHMARNTIARFPPELISTIMLLNKFKRKLNSYAEKQD